MDYQEVVNRIRTVNLKDFLKDAIPNDKERCVLALAFKAEVQRLLGDRKADLEKVEVTGQKIEFYFKGGEIATNMIGARLCEAIRDFDQKGKWESEETTIWMSPYNWEGSDCDYVRP